MNQGIKESEAVRERVVESHNETKEMKIRLYASTLIISGILPAIPTLPK